MSKCLKDKKVKKSSPKGRKWCFTSFKKDIKWKEIYEQYKDIIRYVIVQGEITPTTKKFHWQGYIQMYNQCRMRKLKLLMNDMKVHLELARGSAEDNKAYCSKIKSSTGEKFEFGKAVSQGYRSDLEDIKKCLDDGGSLLDVANNHFGDFIRYHSGFRRYKELVDKELRKKNRKVEVNVISGPTGKGKSWNTVGADLDAFVMDFQNGTEWWDGYNGEDHIIIEEYNNDITITRMLRILDSYRLRLPIKGGFTYANWTKVTITTNLKEDEIHPKAKPEHQNALKRRITSFTSLYEEEETEVSTSVLGNTETKTPEEKKENTKRRNNLISIME